MFEKFDPAEGMLGPLGALMAGAAADENMKLRSLVARQGKLCARLQKFDFNAVLQILPGLLVQPANHAASLRIEALIHLAAIHCGGAQKPTLAQCREWLNDILLHDALGRGEDPVEDVFVTDVPSFEGGARIFEGAWEDSGTYLTDLTSAFLRLRGRPWADQTLDEIMCLIRLSEAIAQRAGVTRYAVGEVLPRRPVAVTARTVEQGRAAVTFSIEELLNLRLPARSFLPFAFQGSMAPNLINETLGHTSLERRPLVRIGDELIVALPTALSAAARRHAIEAANTAGELEDLQAAIGAVQAQNLRMALQNMGVKLHGPPKTLGPGLVAFTGEFDEGGYAAGVLISDDLSGALEDGLQGVAPLMASLQEPVEALEKELAGRPDHQHGLTLLVRGGLGRGYAAGFGDDQANWVRATLLLGDLFRLSWDHEFSALRIWKIQNQEAQLEGRGYEFVNLNGFLNVYGYLEANRFGFVTEEASTPSLVMLATDYVAPLRARVRKALDQHMVLGPTRKRWVEVQRQATDVFFEELRDLPIYVSHLDAATGKLLGCFESPNRPWWVEVGDNDAKGSARSFLFRIWDAAKNWLARVAPRLELEFPDLPAGPLPIRLEFPGIDTWSDEMALTDETPGFPEFDVIDGIIVVRTNLASMRAYTNAKNIGERRLIAAIAQGAAKLAGSARDQAWADDLATEVVGSDEARFVHAIPTSDAQQMVQAALQLPRPRLVEDEDVAWSRLGLAVLSGRATPGPVPAGDEGVLLRTAVERIWERVKARLEGLDRRSVVTQAILNHEAVDKDRAEWRQTAAALLALHRNQTDVVQAHNERESARAAAGTASRALAEMAICTCPVTGGRPCTTLDMDAMIADLTVMLDCAGQCDAYHYGLAAAPLKIAKNGSFIFDLGFLQSLHLPYLYAHQERAFRDGAEEYGEAFQQLEGGPKPEKSPAIPEAFKLAMRDEFGMSVEDMVALSFEMTEAALEAGEPILALARSEVLKRLAGEDRQEAVDADKAFVALTLLPRVQWNEPKPNGAQARDWQPWRMNRKLSLIRRPMVQLDDGPDPLVLVAPGLLDRAVRRMLGVVEGRLPAEMFDSPLMKQWIGSVVDDRGHAFNHRVRDALAEQGFEARTDVLMTELGGDKAGGDVDVLAWAPATGEVWLIECKRLLMDRTVGEIGERLADYTTRGKRNGKRTPIQKHLDRVDFVNANPTRLSSVTGIPLDKLVIRSALVTDSLVPMQFTKRMLDLVDRVADFRGLAKGLS